MMNKRLDKIAGARDAGRTPVRRPSFSMVLVVALGLLSTAAFAQPARTISNLDYSSNSDGSIEILIGTQGSGETPKSFATDTPPRIAVDFANTRSSLEARRLDIESPPVRNVTVAGTGGRTRLVVELTSAASYELSEVSSGYQLKVIPAQATVSSQADRVMGGVGDAEFAVMGVDFRRGDNGAGRILLDLGRRDIAFDSSVAGRDVRLTLYNAEPAPDAVRELDVADFATPVQSIEIRRSGGSTLVVANTNQPFEQLVYQSDNQLVMEIAPPSKDVDEDTPISMSDRDYEGDPITFNFQDISVRAVLQLLADFADMNIVVSDSVNGNITLRLQSVPWDQALDIVMDAKGLDMRQNGNVVLVAPASEIAQREQQLLENARAQQELAPLQTEYIQLNYAKAENIAELLRTAGGGQDQETGILSPRGSVSVDQRTNTLLITDTAEQIAGVRDLVSRLDRPVQQVQIESRVVVATDDFSRELGARFGVTGTASTDSGNIWTSSGSAAANDTMNNLSLIERLNGNSSGFPNSAPSSPGGGIAVPALADRLNVNLPASDSAGRFALSILGSNYLVDLELSALESENRGEVIASPRFITANQAEGFIKQGVEIPYQQASSSGATNVQFKDAVLELRATPLITPDKRILLDLQVRQDTIGELVPVGGAGAGGGGLIPSIDTREIGTQVLVNNGETVVLGGIYETNISETENKVPLLGDIPVFGNLFKGTQRTNEKAELLIFITPRILNESLGNN